MADTGTEMPDARTRGLYETRAQQLQQRIAELVTSFADIEAEADDLRPTHDDDQLRLAQLENRIRYNITALQPLSDQYNEAVAQWNELDADYGIMDSDTPWTRSMFAFRKKCLNANSNRPALPTKTLQLIIDFDSMLTTIAETRNPGERIASLHSSPNPGYTVQSPPTVEGPCAPHGAEGSLRRVRIASPAHSVGTVPPLVCPTPLVGSPPSASNDANPRQLAIYNPLRAFEIARRYVPSFGFGSSSPATLTPPNSSPSAAAAPTPASVVPPRPTPKPRMNLRRPAPRVPIVTQLDHGDDTPVTETHRARPHGTGTYYRAAYDGDDRWDPDHGYSRGGIMSTADPLDGSIHHTRSMAWERDYHPRHEDRAPRGSDFYAEDTSAPRAAPRSGLPPRTGDVPYGPRPSSGPAPYGSPPPPGAFPSRSDGYDLSPYVPLPASEVDRLTNDFGSMAAGRGSEASPRIATPLTTTATAATGSIATGSKRSETTSAFFRNGNFTRPSGAPAAPRTLRELPLRPFDGDIREYHEFRDGFLELMANQTQLSPRQKLGHLLQYLRGAPRAQAEGYGLTDESFWDVTEMLEATYGNKHIIRHMLMRDLVNLPTPAARLAELESFHMDAVKVIQRLKRVGTDLGTNEVLQHVLIDKLPHILKLKLTEKTDLVNAEGFIPPKVILDELFAHINHQKRANSIGFSLFPSPKPAQSRSRPNSRPGSPGPSPGTSSQPPKPHYHNGTYVADADVAVAAVRRKVQQLCAFNGGPHGSAPQCHIYATMRQREGRVRALKLCFVCLRRGHWGQQCPDHRVEPCRHCENGSHHPALCWEYNGGRPGTPRPTPAPKSHPIGESEAHRPRSNGDARNPSIPSGETMPRRSSTKAVAGQGTSGAPDANGTSSAKPMCHPSAQNSRKDGSGNSTTHRKKQPKRPRSPSKKGTNSAKQNGTPCHTADASDENTTKKSSDACPATGLLTGHQALLQTARCSTPSDFARVNGDVDGCPVVGWLPYTRDDEEISLPPSPGHCSNADSQEFDGLEDHYWCPTTLVLRTPYGQVHLDATASDQGVKSVRTALVTFDELPLLHNNAATLISTRERPDILIGQDTVKLFQREEKPDLPCGFYVQKPILGPVVGGSGRVITEEPKDVHVAAIPQEPDTSCQPSQMILIDIMDRSNPRPAQPRPSVPPRTFTTMACPTPSVGTATQPVHCPTLVGPAPRTLPEETVSGYLSGLVEKTDAELLGDFSYLENAGMGTHEMKPDDLAAADMLQALHTRESDGRFNVALLFRTANGEPPSNHELPTNVALAKGRAISTRNTLAKDPKKLADYHEIVLNYAALNFIEIAPRTTPYTKHCLSHDPVFKETSTTTATRPVFDASAKLPGRTCLNDWVFRGPVLLPTVPAILLRSRFPTVIVVSDIGKAFLQMSVKESHRDCLRWFWFKDPFKPPTEDNILEYRFNRVPFGLKSSP